MSCGPSLSCRLSTLIPHSSFWERELGSPACCQDAVSEAFLRNVGKSPGLLGLESLG